MKIPKSKIELATSQEPSRYTLQAVHYDAEKKRFAATDGHILAVIPAEVSEGDHSGLISLDTMKALRQLQKPSKIALEVSTNGKISAEWGGSKIENEYATGTFPDIDRVMPKFDGKPTIGIDAALLIRLAQALSENCTNKRAVVSLWIKDANSAIGVKVGDSDAEGVIMPVRV